MNRRALSQALCALLLAAPLGALPAEPAARPYRILYVMSYHSPWRWTDGQLAGFKEGMGAARAEYAVFQMDTKQHSTAEAKERKGREARALIEAWKPDLVYTTDDDVQEHVAVHYLDKPLPFVFSGVNKDPAVYGFDRSRNMTGVLEHEHFVESVRLLQSIDPRVRRIAVVVDDAPMWVPVISRMRARLGELQGVEIVSWDSIRTWEEFKRKMGEYPARAQAVALIGIFNFKDAAGRNVPYQEVLRWTAENSSLPDIGFWVDRVHYGTLAAVTVSEREQGRAAGRLARAILVEGRSPASLPITPTVKGLPVVSLARARKLGLQLNATTLLSAEVIEKFEWDKQ